MARTPRIAGPRFLQKGIAVTASLVVVDGGVAALPVSGTYALKTDQNATAIAAADTTNADGAVTRAIAADALDAYGLPQNAWREVWTLTYTDKVETFEREVYVCRVAPVCSVTDEDLYLRHAQWRSFLPPNRTSWAGVIGEAFDELVGDLVGDQILPHRVLNPWRFRKATLYRALAIGAADLATGEAQGGKWAKEAERYAKAAELAYEKLTVKPDADEDGIADQGETEQAAEPELFLTHIPRWR